QLVAGEHRVAREGPESPPFRPGAVQEPLVGHDVVQDQRGVAAGDPAYTALLIGDEAWRELPRHLERKATGEREGAALLVGQPEGRQARAGELGGRLGDG